MASSGTPDPSAGGSGTAGDVGHAGSGGATELPPNFPDGSKTLRSLGSTERHAFCLEDLHRYDPCMTQGIALVDLAACESSVSACRASIQPDSSPDCDQSRDLSDCNVTVDQYFQCVDAWNRTQVCDNAGVMIEPPEPCVAVAECSAFRFAFQRFGRPPRCAPETLVPKPPDTNDDIYGLDPCPPIPERFIALGNSVLNWGGKDNSAATKVAEYLKSRYAPSLVYEYFASNSTDFTDLPRQMSFAEPGSGHVAVWIYSLPPNAKETPDYPFWQSQIQTVLDYFSDRSKFPDGATFMLNTQYSPSDQCPDSPAFAAEILTLELEEQLRTMNQKLFIDPALARSDTVTIDQYLDWLGHGWNANVRGCPHCSADNTLWQSDPVHPNDAGRQHIFEKWKVAVDEMYGDQACTR
jgi:hypothetical protein